MAFILKQLLEQGISITTDPYPPSPSATLLQQILFLSALPSSLAQKEEALGDLEELQQTCHALHTELQDTLTYDKGPLSSGTVVRYDVGSPSHAPVSD